MPKVMRMVPTALTITSKVAEVMPSFSNTPRELRITPSAPSTETHTAQDLRRSFMQTFLSISHLLTRSCAESLTGVGGGDFTVTVNIALFVVDFLKTYCGTENQTGI